MNEEKQIEEMAKIIEGAITETIQYKQAPANSTEARLEAEALYKEGYRKQVEGEWEFVEKEAFWISNMEESLRTGKPTKELMPVCSHCKTMFGKIVLQHKFCPECGARMKGVPDEN